MRSKIKWASNYRSTFRFFLKWTSFDEEITDLDKKDVEDVLKNPKKVMYGPCAKDYLTDEETKANFDKVKREAGYNY